jgi:hypothetical protein
VRDDWSEKLINIAFAFLVGALGLAVLLLVTALVVGAFSRAHAQAYGGWGTGGFQHEAGHPDTSPKAMQQWLASLTNNQGGSCCGEADGYHAIIDHEASPGVPGRGHVIDADQPREIWTGGYRIKVIPPLKGDPNFRFDYNHVVKEKYGNPATHAWVFLNIKADGSIDRENTNYTDGVYCVVPLPPAF